MSHLSWSLLVSQIYKKLINGYELLIYKTHLYLQTEETCLNPLDRCTWVTAVRPQRKVFFARESSSDDRGGPGEVSKTKPRTEDSRKPHVSGPNLPTFLGETQPSP